MPSSIQSPCTEPKQKRLKEAHRLTYMADAAIASQNIALDAHALGIGTCIVVSFADVVLRSLLSLPEEVMPNIIVTLGYPDESPEPPPRLPLDEIAFMEEYGKEWPA